MTRPIDHSYSTPTFGYCEDVEDCPMASHYECHQNFCVHKPVFPSYWLEWVGVICYMVVMALCDIGGIGGGGIAQPMIMAFF